MKTRLTAMLVAAALMTAATSAWAHHSFAAYDMDKVLTAQATLKEFHWGAPHSSADFIIMGKDGQPQTLTLIGADPAQMVHQGFNPRDFRRGDTMTVSWHPNHSGAPGGALAGIKFSDGRYYKDAGLLGPGNGASGKAAPPAPATGAPPAAASGGTPAGSPQ